MQPNAPTRPASPWPPGGEAPRDRRSVALVVALVIAALLLGAAVGALVAREAGDPAETGSVSGDGGPVVESGHLEVLSVPADGTVALDGRLVGLTPVGGLKVDPGKHSVVIEVYGFEPYVGTLTVVAGGSASLEAYLAPIGGEGETRGELRGSGSAVHRRPPRPPAPVQPGGAPAPRGKSTRRAPPPEPPQRDCSGERSTCKSKCDSAAFSCRSRCQYCGSCVTNMTWDECNRICETCRQGCEQNEEFCESACEGQYESCG